MLLYQRWRMGWPKNRDNRHYCYDWLVGDRFVMHYRTEMPPKAFSLKFNRCLREAKED